LAKKSTRKKAVKSKSRSAGSRRAKAAKPAKKRAEIRRPGSSRAAVARRAKATDPRTTRRTARKKTAARAAATRKRRSEPKPKPASTTATVVATARGVVATAVKAVVERLPGSKTEPDGIELLEQEHRRFEELLKEGEETTERAKKSRRAILKTLVTSLNAHELMEESVLYPALHSHPEARDAVLEGFEEHHVADLIVKELQDVAEDDEQWGAKFKVLKENIEHHIQEEEKVMFPMARGLFSREELQELAVRMLALKPSPRKRRT
jgi:hemerythrin-like domain-containing protein